MSRRKLIAVDVMLPREVSAWNSFGDLQMWVSVPSLNLYNVPLGQSALYGPKGVWRTLLFQIPNDAYGRMLAAQNYADLSVTMQLAHPFPPGTEPLRLDNLRFMPVPGCVGVPDGTTCDDVQTCTTGTVCGSGSCGTATTQHCDPGDDVLGFENFPAWRATAGSATLALSSNHVQGEHSLSVATPYAMTVTSIELSTLHKVSQQLSLRVEIPTDQPYPWWHGDLTLNISVPSLGINHTSIPQSLLPLQPGGFEELLFNLPFTVYEKLATSTYNDLTFSISINPPDRQIGLYFLDDLHFVPVASCGGVLDNTACEDNSFCTDGDACKAGICGAPVVCNDNNVCTNDSCNPASGCMYTANTAPCSDGSVCTTTDVCSGGRCMPGPQVNCDDGSACTADTCDATVGCQNQFACPAGQGVLEQCMLRAADVRDCRPRVQHFE